MVKPRHTRSHRVQASISDTELEILTALEDQTGLGTSDLLRRGIRVQRWLRDLLAEPNSRLVMLNPDGSTSQILIPWELP